MKFCRLVPFLSTFILAAIALIPQHGNLNISLPPSPWVFDDGLRTSLSPNASISYNVSSVPRWSDYHAPQPGIIVNVATEYDVQKVVSSMHFKEVITYLLKDRSNSV